MKKLFLLVLIVVLLSTAVTVSAEDFYALDQNGLTALHRAIGRRDYASVLRLLLDGADPFCLSKDGVSAADYAIRLTKTYTDFNLSNSWPQVYMFDTPEQQMTKLKTKVELLKEENKDLKIRLEVAESQNIANLMISWTSIWLMKHNEL